MLRGGGGKNQIAAYFNNFETDIWKKIIRVFGHLAFCHSKMCNLFSVICNKSTITSVRRYTHKMLRSFEMVKFKYDNSIKNILSIFASVKFA